MGSRAAPGTVGQVAIRGSLRDDALRERAGAELRESRGSDCLGDSAGFRLALLAPAAICAAGGSIEGESNEDLRLRGAAPSARRSATGSASASSACPSTHQGAPTDSLAGWNTQARSGACRPDTAQACATFTPTLVVDGAGLACAIGITTSRARGFTRTRTAAEQQDHHQPDEAHRRNTPQ